jgi:F420-dependent oxidoreductase-like protein
VHVGLALGAFAWNNGPAAMGETVARIGRTADDAGFALIGVGDHLWQGPHAGGPQAPQLECFTTLATIAAHTRRCRVVSFVAGVHFRPPALLAKTVTTLDVLSGGRATLGLGVGWDEDEATGSGIPFPPVAERFEMLEETLRILRGYWHGEQGDERPFHGRHYRVNRPLNLPQSLSRPHPPIMLGGGGTKTLRLVARYADACNLYPGPDLPDKLDQLRRFCADAGRDYDAIEKTCALPMDVGADGAGTGELITQLRRLAGEGVQTVIGILLAPGDPLRQVEIIGEKVLPAVADARPAPIDS